MAARNCRRKPNSTACSWTRRAAASEPGSAIRRRAGRRPRMTCNELAAIQKNLLANVAPSVKPGGKLIFSVCTLTRAETTEVVDDFNAKFAAEFEPMDIAGDYGPAVNRPLATRTIWPQDLGGNGMFIAGWRRKKIRLEISKFIQIPCFSGIFLHGKLLNFLLENLSILPSHSRPSAVPL